MSEHTPEPWKEGRRSSEIVAEAPDRALDQSEVKYYGGQLIAESVEPRNCRRIVACVNACRGIETEWLEGEQGLGLKVFGMRNDLTRALRERDEARAMVKELADALDICADALRDVSLNERGDHDDGYSNVEKARIASDKARAHLAPLT